MLEFSPSIILQVLGSIQFRVFTMKGRLSWRISASSVPDISRVLLSSALSESPTSLSLRTGFLSQTGRFHMQMHQQPLLMLTRQQEGFGYFHVTIHQDRTEKASITAHLSARDPALRSHEKKTHSVFHLEKLSALRFHCEGVGKT